MTGNTLIIAIRGWTTSGDFFLGGRQGGEYPEETIQTLRHDLPNAKILVPELDLSTFSMRNVEDIANELFNFIDRKVGEIVEVDSIVLLGYSAGSLLARRVFCMAHGANNDGQLSRPPVWWANRVHRLVILAGITRGWEFSTASPDHIRFLSPILFGLARIVGRWKNVGSPPNANLPFIWQLKRGASFVISTRIQYVNVMAKLRRANKDGVPKQLQTPLCANGLPSTVFLLGAKDEFISPADCTELGPRDEFAYVELPGSNHTEVMKVTGSAPTAVQRRQRLIAALSQNFEMLQRESWVLPASDIDDYLDPMDLSEAEGKSASSGDHIQHAVMVVHGIRDNGFWTKRVAREIKTRARKLDIDVRAPSPTYGFFSMWDFVKPDGRQNATQWFMERYADVRSHFPNAAISFVGHSNGTYIAAQAMKLCPAIKFERIVFAGSVVRRDYDWENRNGQVKGILNYVGDSDGVVAFLPAVFELLGFRWLDVGGAGAFGFLAAEPPPANKRVLKNSSIDAEAVTLTEVRYVNGGHGAAIGEDFWPEIADFILSNKAPERENVNRSSRIVALFTFAPVITVMGLAVAICLLGLPLIVAGAIALEGREMWSVSNPHFWILSAILAMAISMGISWLLSRFLKAW